MSLRLDQVRITISLVCLLLHCRMDLLGATEMPKEVLKQCKAATAMIHVGQGSGSAFCVREDGLFITNYHVIAESDSKETIRLVVNSGEENQKSLTARIVNQDQENDLALLQTTERLKLDVIPLGKEEDLHETMSVTALGYPFGRLMSVERDSSPSISVTAARVSSLRKQAGALKAVQLDGAINPGNSGGPMVDSSGHCLGVIVSGIRNSGISFAIPVSRIRQFLNQPGVVVTHAPCSYARRTEPMELHIQPVVALGKLTADEIEIEFYGTRQQLRKVKAESKDDFYVARIAPEAKRPSEDLYLAAIGKSATDFSKIHPGSFQLGRLELNWFDVRLIERHDQTSVVTLNNGRRLAGKITGWEQFVSENHLKFNPSAADRLDLFIGRDLEKSATYRVLFLSKGRTQSEIHRTIDYVEIPATVSPDLLPETTSSKSGPSPAQQKRQQLQQAREKLETAARAMLSRRDLHAHWIALTPKETQVKGGGEQKILDDQSVEIHGGKPLNDVYTVTTQLPENLSSYTGAMLEILGPGSRKEEFGMITISQIELFPHMTGSSDKLLPIEHVRASAFFSPDPANPTGVPAYNLLDDDPKTGWSILTGIPRSLVMEFDAPATKQFADATTLKWVIHQRDTEAIARFRLSVTKDSVPLMPEYMAGDWNNEIELCRQGKRFPYDELLLDIMAGGGNSLHKQTDSLRHLPDAQPPANLQLLTALSRISDPIALPLNEFVVEADVPGKSRLIIYQNQLQWSHEDGPVPGQKDARGRFVIVNGQRWDLGAHFQGSTGLGEMHSEPFYVRVDHAIWQVAEVIVDGKSTPTDAVPLRYEENSDDVIAACFEKSGQEHRKICIKLIKQASSQPSSAHMASEYLSTGPIPIGDLNQEAARPGGLDIAVEMRREQGYQLGPVPHGTKITLQYVKGIWRKDPFEEEVSPDDSQLPPARRRPICIAATSRVTGMTTPLVTVPGDTVKTPFVWTAPFDLARVVLRMNDPDNQYFDNAGQDAIYHIKVESPTLSP